MENQTAGGFIGSNANQYAGGKFHYSGYGGEYGDLKMKIGFCGKLKAVVINRRAEDTESGRRKRFFPNTKPSLPSWSINRPPIRASLIRVRVRHGIRVSPPNIPPSCKSSLSSPTEPLPHRRPSKSEKAKALPGPYFIPEPGPASEATPITTTNTSLVMASY